MRLIASRLPFLLVLLTLPGCPLSIETGYKVEGSAGNTGASAGAGGTLPTGGGGGSGDADGSIARRTRALPK